MPVVCPSGGDNDHPTLVATRKVSSCENSTVALAPEGFITPLGVVAGKSTLKLLYEGLVVRVVPLAKMYSQSGSLGSGLRPSPRICGGGFWVEQLFSMLYSRDTRRPTKGLACDQSGVSSTTSSSVDEKSAFVVVIRLCYDMSGRGRFIRSLPELYGRSLHSAE